MRRFLFGLILFLSISLFWADKSFCQNKKPTSAEAKMIVEKTEAVTRELFLQGEKALMNNDAPTAMMYFTKAAKVAPFNYRSYFLMAEVFMRSGRYDDAWKILERAGPYYVDINALYSRVDELDRSLYQEPQKDKTLMSIAPFKSNALAAITHQFDDGGKPVYTDILPLFDQFGFKATIPINPGVVPEDPADAPWWGTWADWQDAHKRGFEIANHSVDHIDLNNRSDEELEKQINGGYDRIQEKIGVAPSSFAFPLDKVDQASLRKAAQRHAVIRQHDYLVRAVYPKILLPVFGGKYFTKVTAEYILNIAMRHGMWVIAECHSIKTAEIQSYKPFEKSILKEHLQYLKNNEDKIWVDSSVNIYHYLLQKKSASLEWKELDEKSVEFKLTSSLKGNISELTVVIRPQIEKIKKVQARISGQKKTLKAVLSKDNEIYLNVMPSDETIVVEWK